MDLPLIDGHFLVDNSTLELWQTCPRLGQLQHLRGRVLAISRAGRNFGSTLHCGWATRYRSCGSSRVDDAAAIAINEAMAAWLRDNTQPVDDFRSLQHAQRVMQCYNEHYSVEPFRILQTSQGKPFVEASFAFPIGTVQNVSIDYIGRADLGIENNDGEWTMDHKTAFQFGKQWESEMAQNGGQTGYCWAFRQTFGRKPRGYIINGVRIRKPTRKAEYESLPPVDSTDFMRIPHEVSDDNLEEWREDVLAIVATIFWNADRDSFPKHRKHCVGKYGECDFYNVCSLPRESRETPATSSTACTGSTSRTCAIRSARARASASPAGRTRCLGCCDTEARPPKRPPWRST